MIRQVVKKFIQMGIDNGLTIEQAIATTQNLMNSEWWLSIEREIRKEEEEKERRREKDEI